MPASLPTQPRRRPQPLFPQCPSACLGQSTPASAHPSSTTSPSRLPQLLLLAGVSTTIPTAHNSSSPLLTATTLAGGLIHNNPHCSQQSPLLFLAGLSTKTHCSPQSPLLLLAGVSTKKIPTAHHNLHCSSWRAYPQQFPLLTTIPPHCSQQLLLLAGVSTTTPTALAGGRIHNNPHCSQQSPLLLFLAGVSRPPQLLFLAGLSTTIGFRSTVAFFTKRKNRKVWRDGGVLL